jgi:hypothetical protein
MFTNLLENEAEQRTREKIKLFIAVFFLHLETFLGNLTQ